VRHRRDGVIVTLRKSPMSHKITAIHRKKKVAKKKENDDDDDDGGY